MLGEKEGLKVHYCDFEHQDFPDDAFELVRGRLFRHRDVEPVHTDDGALYPPGQVEEPDAAPEAPDSLPPVDTP
jgi:hypothetical protein